MTLKIIKIITDVSITQKYEDREEEETQNWCV